MDDSYSAEALERELDQVNTELLEMEGYEEKGQKDADEREAETRVGYIWHNVIMHCLYTHSGAYMHSQRTNFNIVSMGQCNYASPLAPC